MAYLDTSAIVPMLITEPSTQVCRRVWQDADNCVTSRLAYVEVAAALAMAERQSRISSDQHAHALRNFAEIWSGLDVVGVTEGLTVVAGSLARSLALRGYDAVHCASAVALADPDLVAVAGDQRLLAAWRELGLALLDVNQT